MKKQSPYKQIAELIGLESAGEPYRGPLLALVDEVRRLREAALGREVASGN